MALVQGRSVRPFRVLLVLLVLCAVPGAPLAQNVQEFSDRPSRVPSDFIATPFGWSHPSCIIEVSAREEVQADGRVRNKDDNSFRGTSPCAYQRFDGRGQEVRMSGEESADSGLQELMDSMPQVPVAWDWLAASYFFGDSMSWLSATWTVPAAPNTKSNQILYVFPALMPSSYGFILQPVLGWNHMGSDGNRWSIASWNCCVAGNVWHSVPLIGVSPGQSLAGYVWGTNCNANTGVCSNWQVQTAVAGGSSALLNTTAFGSALTVANGGVLEGYNINSCSQLPQQSGVTFSSVNLTTVGGQTVANPAWTTNLSAEAPNCQYAANTTANTTSLSWCVQVTSCPLNQCGTLPNGCGGSLTCGCGRGPKCYDPQGGTYYAGSRCVNGTCVPNECD